jgi:hypothetical protein
MISRSILCTGGARRKMLGLCSYPPRERWVPDVMAYRRRTAEDAWALIIPTS